MNNYIKELCRLAGLKDMTETTITRAGVVVKFILPKI